VHAAHVVHAAVEDTVDAEHARTLVCFVLDLRALRDPEKERSVSWTTPANGGVGAELEYVPAQWPIAIGSGSSRGKPIADTCRYLPGAV